MPLYQSLAAIILDIGQAYTKIGFAGESAPRAIISTVLKTYGKPDIPVIAGITENPNVDRKHLIWKLRAFLHHIYFKYLQVNPKDRRVIICESLCNLTILREAIADVLFSSFEVPSLLFAPHHLLACFSVAEETALVLDCSEYESSALPVIESTPVFWAWHSAPLASTAICERIQTLIRAGGLIQKEDGKPMKISEDISHSVIEDIKVKSCFVADYDRARKIQAFRLAQWRTATSPEEGQSDAVSEKRPPPPPDMVYPMDGKTLLLIPGLVREEAAEVLFEQDNDRLSVSTIVLDALLKCPIDSRKQLAANLIVSGGACMLPGFEHRFLSELEDFVATQDRYKLLADCKFRVHKTPVLPNIVSWLGASIYATLDIFPLRSISKGYFIQHKRLPDWCVLDLPTSEQCPDRPSTLVTGLKKGRTSLGASKIGTRKSTGMSATAATLASLQISKTDAALPSSQQKQ